MARLVTISCSPDAKAHSSSSTSLWSALSLSHGGHLAELSRLVTEGSFAPFGPGHVTRAGFFFGKYGLSEQRRSTLRKSRRKPSH
jgi:hypothetical protein